MSEKKYQVNDDFLLRQIAGEAVLVPTGEHKNANVPDDIKKVIEKYICIAKNNYQQNGCV